MKVLAIFITFTSIWWTYLGSLAAISLDLESTSKESYSAFLNQLRQELKDEKLVYSGIPMMPKPSTQAQYLMVQLNVTQSKSITLAINRNNLYLVGYEDKYEGKIRAHIFPDVPSNARTTLFPDAKTRLNITFESSYGGAKGVATIAGGKREVGLGIQKLREFHLQVYGKDLKRKDMEKIEAKFLLMTIQMVSEGVRFHYIENQILSEIEKYEFTPNYKILSLEDSWGKISESIRKAKQGNLEPPRVLENPDKTPWKVTKVTDIASDVALHAYFSGN